MSKEEILKYVQEEIENETDTFHWFDDMPNNKTRKDIEKSIQAHQGLLDLYNKEKEKNKFKDSKVRNLIAELDEQKEKYDEKIKQTTVAVIKLLKRTLLEETNE